MKVAHKTSDLLSHAALLSMSGLDFMRGILEGRIPGPPIAQTLGYRLSSVKEGYVSFHGVPEFNATNPMGTVHGGWYGTLLDSAMACAVMTRVPKGSIYTTLEYKISIIRPIPLGQEIVCEGVTDHAGRSTGVARGELRAVSDNTLYATGTTTCLIFTPAS
ncbi:MAG: PaaI family thioesterase [Aestuariivita sp.]|nr:PaaI family thioesterase [Aestuariivita sp.]